MNLFGFQREIQCAETVVRRIADVTPPNYLAHKRERLSVNKVTRSLESAFKLARDQHEQQRFGFFGRAVLGNRVKWDLRQRGYPEDFIEVAVEGLLIEITKPARKDSQA